MRYQDWPERLQRTIEARQTVPFAWGTHDCCLFAADVVLELTGYDPAAGYRGQYATPLEAVRLIERLGGVRTNAAMALGPELSPLSAQRGDVVLINTVEHGDTLAVCLGLRCAAPGPDGLVYLPMSAALAAWRIV